MPTIRRLHVVSFVLLFFMLSTSVFSTMGCATMNDKQAPAQTNLDTIAFQMRGALDAEFAAWYPRSVDTHCGGFFSDLDYAWNVDGPQQKFVVTQARHVWSAAHAARFYNTDTPFTAIAAHGIAFLRDKMWDPHRGGFYDMVTREGEPILEDGRIIKKAYGNSFAVYALAECAGVAGDTAALRMAQETFRWLEAHSYDPQHGGYFQFIDHEGTPLEKGWRDSPPKDQNSSIHLLEAFTTLYQVWPDPTVRKRLEELLHLVRDVITTPRGYMVLFFERDWTPVSFVKSSAAVRARNYEFDHVSFGHDVETAYLMLEASAALGLKNDTTTMRVARKMVDHALAYGWDAGRGGIFDGGFYLDGADRPSLTRTTKEWWCQAEALNSFLHMSELFPGDAAHYVGKFCEQWDYCTKFLIDPEHGGWYWGGLDSAPEHSHSPKASIWKCNYHTSRALINCIRRIHARNLPGKPGHAGSTRSK